MTITQFPWWKQATIYQIYPASFKDSNGDGVGDLPGIISQLDYIKSLGVDAIWVCPMYDSPQYDMGYDISDYENVYPPYGTVQDMDDLIEGCHSRGIRIILDLVINHTSHLHLWFQESRSSRSSPKRDWYIWRPAKYDAAGNRKPPNNWRSNFGGSAWEWDEGTQEYYLHLFCPEQPDLNWENPLTRAAIYESAMEFWLRKGVDGFRIDTVNMYSKDPDLRDAPVIDHESEWQLAVDYYCNGPHMHTYLREVNAILAKYNAMSVGELPNTPDPAKVLKYVSARERQLNMVFNFDVVDLGFGKDQKFDTVPRSWKLDDFRTALTRTQSLISHDDAWTTVFLENHDQARSITRFGSDRTPELRNRSGKMLALMLASLSGTLYIYQGQEIGAVNAPETWDISEYKDVESSNFYNYMRARFGDGSAELQRTELALQHLARDHARLPMQWDSTKHAGFTTGEASWMRVNDDWNRCNVKRECLDKNSVLHFWKRMLTLRKKYKELLVGGQFEPLDVGNESVFAFEKRAKTTEDRAVVILNFTDKEQEHPQVDIGGLERLVGNYDEDGNRSLRPFEAVVYV